MAICGLSNEYKLADVVAHFSVKVDDWFDMNEDQRKAYMNEFNKMSVGNAMKGEAIRVNHVPTEEMSEGKEFSLDVMTILKSFHYWTDGLIATIVNGAEALLNAKDAVQPMPSMNATGKQKFLVASKNCKRGM